MSDANKYLGGAAGDINMRVSVPAYERMKQLYAFGYTNSQIVEVLNQEFHDIDYNPITLTTIKKLIAANMDDFNQSRMELGEKCRDEIKTQVAYLFKATQDVELVMVRVYVKQLQSVLKEMDELDLQEKNEDGNYMNTSRMFVLIEFCDKLQSKIAKVVGTDSLRDIEAYRQKMQARSEAEKGCGALMPAHGRTIDAEPVTNFI